MGSDNPKGAVAKVPAHARAGRYVAMGLAGLVMYVCLTTAPSTRVSVEDTAGTISGGVGLIVGGAEGGAIGATSGATTGASVRRAGDGRGALAAVNSRARAASLGGDRAFPAGDAKTHQQHAAGGWAGEGKDSLVGRGTGLYALHSVDTEGVDTSLGFLAGKMTLVVNVASE